MALYDFPPPEEDTAISGSKQVHALYDFEGQPGTEELSIRCGEVLTVTNTDIGEGWWEGRNAAGRSGLFPQAYVEEVSTSDSDDDGGGGPPPAAPPPPLPPDYSSGLAAGGGWSTPATRAATGDDDWGSTGWGLPPVESNGQQQQQQEEQQQKHQDPWGMTGDNQTYEDWDSDFDDGRTSGAIPAAPAAPPLPDGGTGDGSSKRGAPGAGAAGKTSFNRFSTFVKSGGENYVLGKLNMKVQESDLIAVVDNGDGTYSWQNTRDPYSCSVTSPKKESKMRGLKSFVAYQLTPSFNNIQVSRRYKHFDWLHERLEEKFSCIPVPPLPDKQIQGRYEKEFLDHRMHQLQNFVDRVCRHPVLSHCEVWQHFLTCTDEKRWKSGKRKAEKDPFVGGAFFMAIRTPEKSVDKAELDHQVTVFTAFMNHMDGAVRNLQKTCADQTQKYQSHFRREYQTVGRAFLQLGEALRQDGSSPSAGLTRAIVATGEGYEEIGRMFDEQTKLDWERLGDVMHDYRGILSEWPGVLQIHSGAMGKRREFEKICLDGKIDQVEAREIGRRTDTLSYALLAEMNTFHVQKHADMKTAHQNFLQEQIKFYQKITEKLQEALRMFESA